MSRESRNAILISLAVVLAFVVAVTVMACGIGAAAAGQPKPPDWHRIDLPEEYDGGGVHNDAWTFCDHGNRVYIYDRGVGAAAADPSCAGR